jgi:hypothetical protein
MTAKPSGMLPLLLVSLLAAGPIVSGGAQAGAQNASASGSVALNPSHPDQYTVVKGDTLWDISARFLSKPWLWPEVWYANPQIKNPHLIYPGDVISLVYVNGRPQLRVRRGAVATEKLSPQVRSTPLDSAIPTIPIDAIQQFLNHSRVFSQKELDAAPYIVESADEHLITGAGDRVYVRRLPSAATTRYSVYREGQVYRDPDTNEQLGVEALYIGDANLQRFGDPSTLQLVRTTREAKIGDRLFPVDSDEIQHNFLPHAPASMHGRIIAVIDGVTQIGQHQVVVLNRGTRDGLEVGHVLAISQAGDTVADTVSGKRGDSVTLPDERAGILMVFRTFDRVSYALVMSATRAIHVLDKVDNP